MAEGGSNSGVSADQTGENGPPMDAITAGLMSGQSKSTSEEFLQFSDLENPREGKNKLMLVCLHCKCKVIKPGYATLVDKEVIHVCRS